MDLSLYHAQCDEALANLNKPANDWKPNDFLYLMESGLKNDCGIRNIIGYCANHDCEPYRILSRIEGVIHVATDDDLLNENFENPFAGGCVSDCIDEKTQWHQITDEQRKTIYTLCTLVISDESGRYLAFDREGYEYNRYILMPKDWRTMYAQEIAHEKAKDDARKKEQAEREEAERQAVISNFEAQYGWLPKGERLSKVIGLLLKSHNIEAKVTETNSRYNWRTLNIRCSENDRNDIKCILNDAYAIGYWSHDAYTHLFASIFGSYEEINWR